MKFALCLCVLLAAMLSATHAQENDCPKICPALWAPICAKNSADEKQTFANECQLKVKNCNDKTDFAKFSVGAC